MAVRAVVHRIVHVAYVDVFQTLAPRNVVSLQQGFDRSLRPVSHAKIGMKGREVHGDFVMEMGQDPIAQFAQFLWRVVFLRNNQVRDFEPNVRLLIQPLERVEYRLQMRVSQLVIELFAERFQVHIHSVHLSKKDRTSFRRNVAGSHGDILDAKLSALFRCVNCVFRPDDGVIIGIGDTATLQLMRRLRDRFGRCVFAESRYFTRL